MKKLLPLFVYFGTSVSFGQTTWFADDFNGPFARYWHADAGDWTAEDGRIRIETENDDLLLAAPYYLFDNAPYAIEVRLRGDRAGVYFCLDDTATNVLSHMVRFEGASLLCGYFDGAGEYTTTRSFAIKPASAWRWLQIVVEPGQGKYTVSVDGDSLGADELIFPSGYVGLQASSGDSEFDEIKILGAQKPFPPKPPAVGEPVQFNHVRYVRSLGRNVVLYNPELGLLQTLSPDGKLVRQEPAESSGSGFGGVFHHGKIYSIAKDKIVISDLANAATDSITEHLVAPAQLLMDEDGSMYVADVGAKAILKFDAEGHFVTAFSASSIGGLLAPRGLSFHREEDIVIADYDKLVFMNKSLEELQTDVTFPSPTQAAISWRETVLDTPRVGFRPDKGGWRDVLGDIDFIEHQYRVTLDDLNPLQRYTYQVSPTLQTIPRKAGQTYASRFSTPPTDPAMMALTRLPILVLVYRNVRFHPDGGVPQAQEIHTLSDSDIAVLKQAAEFNREFYFRNTACRLLLHFDFHVVEDTLVVSDIGNRESVFVASNARMIRDFEFTADGIGKPPDAYAGLVCVYPWQDVIATELSTENWKYRDTTWFTVIPFERSSRPDWLIADELHHQMDRMMAVSEHREYPDVGQPWKLPGRFGEDFDFVAHALRSVNPEWWLHLKFGELTQTQDADGDGVPDADTSLPFDEQRLFGNPNSSDSDADGLSDLEEIMSGTHNGTRLNAKDTDGDGLIDSVDPEPLYPILAARSKSAQLKQFPTKPLGTVLSDSLLADLYFDWNETGLLFGYDANRLVNFLIQIDANVDGWFHGFDNFQIRVHSTDDSVEVVDYYLWDCSSWSVAPAARREILNPEELVVRNHQYENPEKRYTLSVKILPNPEHGLALKNGKKLAIRIGLQTVDDRWIWNELFERNDMMTLELR